MFLSASNKFNRGEKIAAAVHHSLNTNRRVLLQETYFRTEEVNYAAKVTDWLSEGLQSLLPEKVEANLVRLALLRHSRGGKTTFSPAPWPCTSKFSVLLGLDPVAGATKGCRSLPHKLTYVPQFFNLSMQSL
ncbi:Chlorophyllase [Quillaja saponaria]|uniref:Chlorophyllase n=1 Tax=Quillaja saponaria TaxID=32244 RepID=A0AAD7PN15_QUISA|nr:Chlorophyllase [Quillaja saponaria]